MSDVMVRRATGIEVDLSVLAGSSFRLVNRVLREGVVVYCGDEPARVRFESVMRRLAGDFALHAEPLDRMLLQAIGEGRR
jgi:chromosome condensin MukBEF MukE localization factor